MTYTVSNRDTTIEWGLEGEDRIVQNVLNLIRTRKYEVPFMRDLGIDPNFIDNNQTYLQMQIKDEIIDTIEKYESRATVINVVFSDIGDDGELTYEVEIEV